MMNLSSAPARFLAPLALLLGVGPLASASVGSPAPGSVEWTADIDAGLERAGSEQRIVLVALGTVLEQRSERHLKELYGAKLLRPYLSESINLAAWQWFPGDEKRLPSLGGYTRYNHTDNLEAITRRWLRPNPEGVIALPQHLWLSARCEVLLSCPWEIDLLEFAWCCDEALRRAGVEHRPKPVKGAHPPRRLLLGEVYQASDDDPLGRGLRPKELTALLDKFKRRVLSAADGQELRRLVFTDDADSAKYMLQELALWDLASGVRPELEKILEGTIHLTGMRATATYLPVIEQFSKHPRASMRAQVAVAIEQIGSPEGLAVVKKALKKEKDEDVRAEWARALGACGRSDVSVGKTLARMAAKEKNKRVRASSIFALGHVLPEPKAYVFLTGLLEQGRGDDRRAALLALALGRAVEARPLVAKVANEDPQEETREVATKVLEVLDGQNLISLRETTVGVVHTEIERWRIFFWRGG